MHTFDQHAMNHIVVAISQEMMPRCAKRYIHADTLFMGSTSPSEADEMALARFGQNKNYKIILPSFAPADVGSGPIGYNAIVTDGVAETVALSQGRLWKRDRASAAVLLFPGIQGKLRLSSRGRLIIGPMTGQYREQGYDLARDAVLARAAGKPGTAPAISPIGNMITVMDIKTLSATFAAAA